MKIAIDLDDTQSNFCESWIRLYNSKYNDYILPKDVKDWDIENYCNKCTKSELYELLSIDNFFTNVKPVKNAKRVIDKLRAYGHEVFTVTAYSPNVCVDKSYWLEKHMGFNQEDIIFCSKKYLISADMLIDDGAHNHKKFNGIKVVYNRPHNQHMLECEYDIRVNNWNEFETYCKLNGIL